MSAECATVAGLHCYQIDKKTLIAPQTQELLTNLLWKETEKWLNGAL